MGPRLEFNFACPRCESLLESHTGLTGQPGRCPACGAKILVPEVNRRTGRTQRSQLLDDGGEAPAPIHAYAASGLQRRIFDALTARKSSNAALFRNMPGGQR